MKMKLITGMLVLSTVLVVCPARSQTVQTAVRALSGSEKQGTAEEAIRIVEKTASITMNFVDHVPEYNMVVNGKVEYTAAQSITIGGTHQFTVSSGGKVHLHAGNEIRIGPGFYAAEGSEFSATVDKKEPSKPIGKKTPRELFESAEEAVALPTTYGLFPNHPNPFNPYTTISYGLPEDSKVLLKVFNGLGQEVCILVDEVQPAGYKSVGFNASNLPSGVYFYRLTAGKFTDIKKMILLK